METAQTSSFGERLQRERKQRNWTQDHLAECIGVAVLSIHRWENDETFPRPTMLEKLYQTFGKTADTFGIITPPKHIAWNIPFLRNLCFTGRDQILLRLHQALGKENRAVSSQPHAICGLSGIGKTQIALEYAYRYANEYEAVLWVQADSQENLVLGFSNLAQILDLPEKVETDQSRIIAAVKHWLQQHTSWLLILDNADDLALVSDFLPRSIHGAILLTTCSHIIGGEIKKIGLKKMSQAESITFLLRRIVSREEVSEEEVLKNMPDVERHAAAELWKAMDGLPLALDQAAAYIEAKQYSIRDYLELYSHHREALLRERGELIPAHPRAVATTWSLSFQRVEMKDPAAAELLRLCAFLAPEAIPQELVTAGATYFPSHLRAMATSTMALNAAISTLGTYSLVHRDHKAHTLSIHRLVQAVLQDTLSETEKRNWAERAILAVNAAFPESEHTTWPLCESLLIHALTVTQTLASYHIVSEEAGRLLYAMAFYLQDRERYSEAEKLYLQARQIREQILGSQHPDVAAVLIKLADLYRIENKYAQAEPLYLQALSIRKQHPDLGPQHPDVAVSFSGLANLYREQGRFAEAMQFYQQAQAIFEHSLQPENPQTVLAPRDLWIAYARALNNQGGLNKDMGNLIEAEALYLHARQIFEQHAGPRHHLTAIPVNNLAVIYKDLHEYDKAEPLYQLGLAINEELLGLEHSHTALACNNLADFYREQGIFDKAEPLYQRAHKIWELRHGSNHYLVAIVLTNLADNAYGQENYREAESRYLQALDLFEQLLEKQHYMVAYSLRGLANLNHKLGKNAEAEQNYLRALAIRTQALGFQHPETAESLYDLGQFREAQGNIAEARTLYSHALEIREQVLSAHDPKIAEIRTRLISLDQQAKEEGR